MENYQKLWERFLYSGYLMAWLPLIYAVRIIYGHTHTRLNTAMEYVVFFAIMFTFCMPWWRGVIMGIIAGLSLLLFPRLNLLPWNLVPLVMPLLLILWNGRANNFFWGKLKKERVMGMENFYTLRGDWSKVTMEKTKSFIKILPFWLAGVAFINVPYVLATHNLLDKDMLLFVSLVCIFVGLVGFFNFFIFGMLCLTGFIAWQGLGGYNDLLRPFVYPIILLIFSKALLSIFAEAIKHWRGILGRCQKTGTEKTKNTFFTFYLPASFAEWLKTGVIILLVGGICFWLYETLLVAYPVFKSIKLLVIITAIIIGTIFIIDVYDIGLKELIENPRKKLLGQN